jgi:hypothetical protein
VRRLVVAVLLLATSCSAFQRSSEALSPSATASPAVAGASGPTPAHPPIEIDAPHAGDEVVSPLTISGVARTASGTLIAEIVGPNGADVAAVRLDVTCGTDCRAPYSTDLAFFVRQREAATIRVFEPSAADGTALHTVTVPVTLVPGT